MRVVIAPDSFKECLDAPAVAEAIARGWRRADPHADLVLRPMADGGEGTAAALAAATGGRLETRRVCGPDGAAVAARFAWLGGDGAAACIEAAEASGLHRVPPAQRDPARTTSYGTGELIRAALDAGARRIVVGLGGTATNDAGAGMARALGYRLLDAGGRELPPGGIALTALDRIDAHGVHPGLRAAQVTAACDVDNPLCGPTGATAVYGPQKGLRPEDAAPLDAALARMAAIAARDLGAGPAGQPGAGAAGGLGFGVMAFLGASLRPGVAIVAEACALEAALRGADLALTGEGRLDAQSLRGKTPIGVARLAARCGVPAIVIAGSVVLDPADVQRAGFARAIPLAFDGGPAIGEARARAVPLLEAAAARLAAEFGGR